jgi:hypothetical protein
MSICCGMGWKTKANRSSAPIGRKSWARRSCRSRIHGARRAIAIPRPDPESAAACIFGGMKLGLLSTSACVVLALSGVAEARSFPLRGAGSGSSPPPVTCPQGVTGYADGCSAAVAASTQFSSVRAGYADPPVWNIAGFDYAVGIPTASLPLQDVTTASLPSGATYNSGTHTVTVSGSNVTLNGLDFSQHNGTILVCAGSGMTLENSLLATGTNMSDGVTISSTSACVSPTFINDEWNGNNVAVTAQVGQFANFTTNGGGTWTFRYDYLHSTGGDLIDFTGSAGMVPIFEYTCSRTSASTRRTPTRSSFSIRW